MIECKKCGSKAERVSDPELIPGELSVAIRCSNWEECYNDTHWQSSWHAATKIWNANPVDCNIRGGQGNPKDDDNIFVL